MAKEVTREDFDKLAELIKQLCVWVRFPVIQIESDNKKQSKRTQLLLLLGKNKGLCCEICSITDIRFLEIDHIKGNGHEDREVLRHRMYSYYLDNPTKALSDLRILCRYCNNRVSTKIGIEYARKNGKRIGRPSIVVEMDIIRKLEAEGLGRNSIAKQLGICKSTLYKIISENKNNSSLL